MSKNRLPISKPGRVKPLVQPYARRFRARVAAVDLVHHLVGAYPPVCSVGTLAKGINTHPVHTGHLHHQVLALGLLETFKKQRGPENHGVGRCYNIRADSGLLHQHLFFPELPDSHLLVREVAVGGRLPGGQQAQLRSPLTHHPALVPIGTTPCRWWGQVVFRKTAIVPATKGFGEVKRNDIVVFNTVRWR